MYLMALLFKIVFYTIIFLIIIIGIVLVGFKIHCNLTKRKCKSDAKLYGKTALVTGGNIGIGLETARDLARRGARVIIASRNVDRSAKAVADIIKTTGNPKVEHRYLDLGKFSSVRKFVEDFNKSFDQLHILVNNAGCAGLKHQLTEDGIDIVVQINYLGPFLLTNLLRDKLIASAPSRVVIVSSHAHYFAKLDLEDLEGKKKLHHFFKYANTKLYNILWAKALARSLPSGVTVNALHPGVVKSNFFHNLHPFIMHIFLVVTGNVFKNVEEGAQTSIHLAVAEELENKTGGYYYECVRTKESNKAKNQELIEKVWINSLSITKS